MARQLTDIRPGNGSVGGEGVSLVFRGANRRQFLLAKSADEVDGDIVEILSAPGANEGTLLDAVRKAGGDESVEKAAAAYARAADALTLAFGEKGVPDPVAKAMRQQGDMEDDDLQDGDTDDGDELDDDDLAKTAEVEGPVYKRDFTAEQRRDLAKKGHALKDGSYPIDSKADIGPAVTLASSGHGDVDAAKTLIKRRAKELGATDQLPDSWNVQKEDRMTVETAVPVKKEDGTYDLSAVPEDARATLEAVLKARDEQEAELAELRKSADAEKTKADEAIAIAKAERDARETREFVAKSAELEHLAKDDSEFGDVLKSIARAEADSHLPEGTVKKLDTVLKAADEAVSKGALFAEAGRYGGSPERGDAETKIEKAADEIRKAHPDLSREQAYDRALSANPDLYAQLRKEQ